MVNVAIIGGGPAGATAAICLARAGLQTLIVERRSETLSRVGESLAPSATRLLERLGLLPAFLATDPLPSYANRSSWGGDGRLVDYDFIRHPLGNGWHVDRRRFDRMLLDAAVASGANLMSGAALIRVQRTATPATPDAADRLIPVTAAPFTSVAAAPLIPVTAAPFTSVAAAPLIPATVAPLIPATVASLIPATVAPLILSLSKDERLDRRPWLLELRCPEGPTRVEADFVIDASGRRSAFARMLGARRVHMDRMVAVTAFLQPGGQPSEDSTTLVEAVPEGWWYSGLLPNGQMAAAFMTDPDLLVRLGVQREGGWLTMLASAPHTRKRLEANAYHLAGRPRVSAAGTARLERLTGNHWLAAGDAATSYDPLSSHGIGTAISTGAQSAAVAAAFLAGDIASPATYEARLAAGFERYLGARRSYYADQTRWPDAPFWSRRREAHRLALPELTAI